MVMNFKYGFEEKGFIFGWKDKELYRLSSIRRGRHYPLKKLKKIIVGNQAGYNINRKKQSINQLLDKTVLINKQVAVVQDSDVPY